MDSFHRGTVVYPGAPTAITARASAHQCVDPAVATTDRLRRLPLPLAQRGSAGFGALSGGGPTRTGCTQADRECTGSGMAPLRSLATSSPASPRTRSAAANTSTVEQQGSCSPRPVVGGPGRRSDAQRLRSVRWLVSRCRAVTTGPRTQSSESDLRLRGRIVLMSCSSPLTCPLRIPAGAVGLKCHRRLGRCTLLDGHGAVHPGKALNPGRARGERRTARTPSVHTALV